jgi:hypothetical protein
VRRVHQIVLIVSVILGSWLGMQAVHELGHVMCAIATGASVTGVVLDPFTFSRTDVDGGRYPLLEVWGGPLGGVALPLLVWLVGKKVGWPGTYLIRFFAGFCLVANGVYLGIGSFGRAGDPSDLLRYGSPVWQLWAFALITVPAGLWLWHNLGASFGLGPTHGQVSRRAAYVCLATVLTWTIAMVAVYHR